MKKIMFNDRFGLTQAVLDRRKTMTRRLIGNVESARAYFDKEGYLRCNTFDGEIYVGTLKSAYHLGEEVAIAQSYADLAGEIPIKPSAGQYNKMFVRADFMPHRIRIIDIKVEWLQDISEEDCMREGLLAGEQEPRLYGFRLPKGTILSFATPRDAFAALIDRISGKGTWKRNPWVFAYEFELVNYRAAKDCAACK